MYVYWCAHDELSELFGSVSKNNMCDYYDGTAQCPTLKNWRLFEFSEMYSIKKCQLSRSVENDFHNPPHIGIHNIGWVKIQIFLYADWKTQTETSIIY